MRSAAIYRAMLVLYPKRFRLRFAGEMIQLFTDCSPHRSMAATWIETLRDLTVSLPREWRREIHRDGSSIDSTLVLDALMVAAVVGPLLLGWGWTTTVVILGLGPEAQESILWTPSGALSIAFATIAMACLVGVVSAMAAARTGRIDTTSCSKYASYEKPTVPSLR
jgi:hypothetical protein